MSQRDSASRTASPRTSTSPTCSTNTQGIAAYSGLRGGGGDPRADSGSDTSSYISSTNGESTQPFAAKGLGVRNILNPSVTYTSPTPPIDASTRPLEGNLAGTHPLGSIYGGSSVASYLPSSIPGNRTVGQHGNPTSGPSLLLSMSSTDRRSPTAPQMHPAIGASRRILTPRSPRSTSVHLDPSYRTPTPQQAQYYSRDAIAVSRTYSAETTAPHRQERPPNTSRGGQSPSVQAGGTHSPNSGGPRTGLPPLTTPRTIAQPMPAIPGHLRSPPPQQTHLPNAPGSRHPPRLYPPGIPSNARGFPPSGPSPPPPPTPPPQGDTRWGSGFGGGVPQGGQTGARPVPSSDGQGLFGILPTHGDNIIVPIEMYQGSRQADEKRQRNAGASARFRQRKKDREKQQTVTIQKLEAQNREIEKRLQDAEGERDRYRAERDRLRDIVQRTPEISGLAFQGPPSPMSSRSGGSFAAERSPLVHAPPPALQPPPPSSLPIPPYGAPDPITGERPSQRRRTDPQLDFTSPSYGPPPLTSLPPMPSTYNAPMSQPGTPSATSAVRNSRLPPLRLEQPAGPSSAGGSNTSTPVQTLPSFKREPYESGWPREPHDPDQR